MALTIRQRGKVWHARGTIRIGHESVVVREFSTGQTSRSAAVQVADREAARIRQEALDGSAGRSRRLTIADCLASYTTRPDGLAPYDLDRVSKLNELMGHRPIAQAAAGWQDWLAKHPKSSAATAQRWRTILAAALRHGSEALDVACPKLPAVKQAREVRVVYLTADERRRLLAAYTPHAACPVLLLAYQGLRTQEALRLDWRHVDLVRETLHIPADGSKTGRGRTAPMHQRVHMLLLGMWHSQGKPHSGPVFRSLRGTPYADTRGLGGNPLKRAHQTACEAVGIEGFRIHDWRHDWAARHVMAGTDLYTLMRLGGWTSLRMVERYASVTVEHIREAQRRIA